MDVEEEEETEVYKRGRRGQVQTLFPDLDAQLEIHMATTVGGASRSLSALLPAFPFDHATAASRGNTTAIVAAYWSLFFFLSFFYRR